MSCREHEERIVDVARDVAGSLDAAALLRHAEGCEDCGRRLRRERALTAGLRALDAATPGEGPSPRVELALLAAFAEHQRAGDATGRIVAAVVVGGRRGPARWGPWMAAAAALLLVVVGGSVAWRIARVPEPPVARAVPLDARPVEGIQMLHLVAPVRGMPVAGTRAASGPLARRESAKAGATAEDAPAAFVPWPGAAALPPFESGELVRTELPASVLPLLGIATASQPASETVAVDVVVGQDGFARAVRLARR